MRTDCVVIGFNDYPLDSFAVKAKPSRMRCGDYAEIARNSYLINGKRIDFCGLLNHEAHRVLGFDPEFNAFELPSLGAFYLADYLRDCGLGAEVINLFNKEQPSLDQLLADQPTAVVITTTYYVSPEPVEQLVSYVRSRSPQTKVIVGGPFIAHLCMAHPQPEEQAIVFRVLPGDIFITDPQGEATLAHVLVALRDGDDLRSVPNLVYRESDGSMVRTAEKPENNRLEDNRIDWSRFSPSRFTPVSYMRTSRSCPFSCAFCNYPAMGGRHQVMGVDPVVLEMRQLRELGTRFLIFTDDTFNIPPSRFKGLLKAMIAERFDFRWISFFRCSHVDDECFDLMAASGCFAVYLGIESGDESVLRAMNKYATAAQYRNGLRKLNERGILTFGSFITGHPGETRDSVLNTVDFIEETQPTFFNTQLFFLDPTAPIARQESRDRFGIVGAHYRWRHREMTWEEASAYTDSTLRSITSSIQLPLYGFSIWSVPYLLTKGFTLEQVKEFAAAAQAMMVKALGDQEGPYEEERSRIDRVLRAWDASRSVGGSRER